MPALKNDTYLNGASWRDKLSHRAQTGGIETSVLDNGTARGTRIAWINTGSGLRFKVVLDRAMDIADAFYNQYCISWLNDLGVTPPQPFSNKGIDWLQTFGGGLLITCGLTHVGGPESDEYGDRGLHGQISNIPAEIESIIQPDPVAGKMDMSITGRVKETRIFGPNLEMKRTVSATVGQASIRIHDEILNRGNTPAPHMLLYHFNFGWPLADEGTRIIWQGPWQPRFKEKDNKIFSEGNDFRTCPPPLIDHSGTGEEVGLIAATPDRYGQCSCGLHNANLGLAVKLNFTKKQLPWLTNWQHWGKGEYVTGLEPGTNPPMGQAKARELGELIFIEPGETRMYDVELEVLGTEEQILHYLA